MDKIKNLIKKRAIVFTTPDEAIIDVVKRMVENRTGALPVLEGDKIVGVFSERDLMKRVVLEGRSVETTLIKDVMTADPIVADGEDSYAECLVKMRQCDSRHLPVVENGKLTGIASMREILYEEIERHRTDLEHLETYIFGHQKIK